jgi:hypothetical protein
MQIINLETPESRLTVEEHDNYLIEIWDESSEPGRLSESHRVANMADVYEIIQNFLKSEMGL